MSNLNSIKAVYDAFATGNIATVIGALSPEIDWTEAEGFPYAGTYHGPRAVLEGVFMRLGGEWNGFAAVADEFVDGGDTVVALGKYSFQREVEAARGRPGEATTWRHRSR